MTSKPINLIVAVLKSNYGIGYQGKLPWKLSKEMKYFKDVTTKTSNSELKNVVIMGRKTWESIPTKFRPLPNRINVILSRSFTNEEKNGIIYANNLENSIKLLPSNIDKIFLIGGGEIYNQYIDQCSNLLITEIEHDTNSPIEMDTFLKFNTASWEKASNEELKKFTGIEFDQNIQESNFTYNYTLWRRK